MSNKRNIAIIAAVAAALNWTYSIAEEQDTPPTRAKTAAELINEARERMEGKQWEKLTADPYERSWYFSLGGETLRDISLDEVNRTLAVQRDSTALQFIEPRQPFIPEESNGFSLALGFELTKWLDVELAAHSTDSFWQGGGYGAVRDPTLSEAVQSTDAKEYYRLDVSMYSLSLLPRWDINEYIGIFGRVGIGYADTMLLTDLSSAGFVSSSRSCSVENGQEKCTTTYNYERRQWGSSHETRSGTFPVAAIGVQLLPFFRLEYIYRFDVPVAEASTDIKALYFSFRMKSAWF